MNTSFKQRFSVLVLSAALLAGCAVETALPKPEKYLSRYGITAPSGRDLIYCSGHNCRNRTALNLSDVEWAQVTAPFDSPSNTAGEERKKIADAMGAYEKIGGIHSDSRHDKGRTSMNDEGQLDCIDETINSLSLLILLSKEGLMKWHRPSNPEGRGTGFDWPHYTATITELAKGTVYSVDSWFFDNGTPAVVMEIDSWKAGWNPE